MFGLIGLHTIFIPLIGLPTRFSNQPALTLIPMQSKRSKISWTAASRSNRKRKFKSNNSSINFFFKQTINSQTRPARCHIQPKVAASSIVILFFVYNCKFYQWSTCPFSAMVGNPATVRWQCVCVVDPVSFGLAGWHQTIPHHTNHTITYQCMAPSPYNRSPAPALERRYTVIMDSQWSARLECATSHAVLIT